MDKEIDKDRVRMQHKFDDFAECTEYYYDELGKLEAAKENGNSLSRKEAKKMHDYIMASFFAEMNNLKAKSESNAMIDKTEVKEFNKEYKAAHKVSVMRKVAPVMQKAIQPVKHAISYIGGLVKRRNPKVEVIEEASLLDASSSALIEDVKSKKNSQKEKGNSGKKDDANV